MKYILATAALVATATAQECLTTVPYQFEVTQANVTLTEQQQDKRDFLQRRVTTCTNSPVSILKLGNITDQDGFQGTILQDIQDKNTQFQYDPIGMLQKDALFAGFCVNSNGTLSHPTSPDKNDPKPSAIFYNCKTFVNGTVESKLYGFNNLGDASGCSAVYLQVIECSGGTADETYHTNGGTTQSVPSATGGAISVSATSAAAVTTGATSPSDAPVPYPVDNATAPVASGSAAPSGSPAATSPAAYNPANGANGLVVGSQLLAGVAAIGAFALF